MNHEYEMNRDERPLFKLSVEVSVEKRHRFHGNVPPVVCVENANNDEFRHRTCLVLGRILLQHLFEGNATGLRTKAGEFP